MHRFGPLIVQVKTGISLAMNCSPAHPDVIRAAAAAPASYYYPPEAGTS
jgi:hypothetical protein